MAYNQGLGGGYANTQPNINPGYNTVGTNTTGVGGGGYGGGGYVQPPQNVGQTTGLTPGAGAGAGIGQQPQTFGQTSGLTPGAGVGAGIGQQQGAVVGEQYVAQTVRSYAVSKKRLSVSHGDWTITDQVGQNHYKVDGRVASVKDKRVLKDAHGNKILTMKKKLITLHDTWEILGPDGKTVLATCKKSSLVQFRTAMDVMLASSTTGKHTPDYHVKGDFFDRNVTIFRGPEQAALVTRQITFTTVILDKDTFGVTIFPGVDEALIFAVLVIMDEVFLHDNGDNL